MRIQFLGTGTSHGVPMIGCDCEVCLSSDPYNHRMRPSIVVSQGDHTILVDTTPELRMQAIRFGLKRVDAVLITHTHADHIMGLDDMRRFNDLAGAEIPVYGEPNVLDDVKRIFNYVFRVTQTGGGKPRLTLHELPEKFNLYGIDITPLRVIHGKLPVIAYRFDVPGGSGNQSSGAYVTDVSEIPAETMERLRNLDLLILDAVRFEPHVTHFGLYQALDVIAELQPRRALLTHLSHHFDHSSTNALLPDNVRLAYDGQLVEFGSNGVANTIPEHTPRLI